MLTAGEGRERGDADASESSGTRKIQLAIKAGCLSSGEPVGMERLGERSDNLIAPLGLNVHHD